MKKTLLLILALCGTMSMKAQESPWVSAEPATGTFYLYNVESGMWLQNNRRAREYWTTFVQVGPHGFDFNLTKMEDGRYQLDPRFGHNHSVNGGDNDYGYMDTGQDVTYWDLEKTDQGYVISANNKTHYLNVSKGLLENVVDDDWVIDDLALDDAHWLFVTKEARLADLEKATKENGKDATWLIDDWDFANQNERWASWKNEVTGSGSGIAVRDGFNCRANRGFECWSKGHGEFYQVIEGVPNGTYGLTVQGFYRDGSTSGVLGKYEEGTEEFRAWYFANDASAPFMSICENDATEEVPDALIFEAGFYNPGNGGDALPRATTAFFLGYYKNPELKVVVTDGTLRIGIRKESDTDDDWLCFDNFELTYYGSGIDLSEVKGNLQKTLDEAAAYQGTVLPLLADAISNGQNVINGDDATAIAAATTGIQQALAATKAMNAALASAEEVNGADYKPNFFTTAYSTAQSASQATDAAAVNAAATELVNAVNQARDGINTYNYYNATVPLALKDGVAQSVVDATQPVIEASASLGEMNNALETLRTARKIAVAETHPDVFPGNAPEDGGDYYIYNVGLKRFLCGGGDWGAHAYVGFPGVEITLYADTRTPGEGEEFDPYSGFIIDTQLFNGDDLHYLNYGGYMDTGGQDLWEFVPVEGKAGVYNIARANGEKNDGGQRMLLGYRPNTYGNIDTDMYGESDVNNQWKLVTAAERDALLATATNDNPQDASYLISCPNFNQREDDSAWVHDNGTIWGRGGNNKDFPFECWNQSTFTLSQIVDGLPEGWYILSATGFYREGDHEFQTYAIGSGGEALQQAKLFAFFDEALLPNITAEIDQAPGLGATIRVAEELNENGDAVRVDEGGYYVGEYPYWAWQACDYFESGLYKTQLLTHVDNSGELEIGVYKEDYMQPRDWVVVDNFRLTYFGKQQPDIDAIEAVRDNVAKQSAASSIFNLQGQKVSNATQRGIYIKDGKKIVVK